MKPDLPTGTVSFLFTDIEGSTPLWEKIPKVMHAAEYLHHAILHEAIESNDGVVFNIVGDAFCAAFTQAPNALAAAVQAQRRLHAADWPVEISEIKVRMGIHVGPAELAPDGDYALSHTLNRVARVMSAGYGGQILLSQEAKDLVERTLLEGITLKDLGEQHLKGMSIPERLYQVTGPGLQIDFPALSTGITYLNNLPNQLTSFIGREKEIAAIGQLLEKNRLVTLTGSGGTGKTRLALKTSEAVMVSFSDGTWLVELAPLVDPSLVALTAAQVFGLRQIEGVPIKSTLTNYLRNKHLLLILDNCEHLLAECSSMVEDLLKACPRLHMLATSREILGVSGEIPFRVPSLSMPDPNHLPGLEQISQFESVRLFIERASQVAPDFALSEASASAIATICQRLDGIPLAIELASARVRVMTALQIAARLGDVFRILTGGSRNVLPRQQTLKATIDWSFALLSGQERLALQLLSAFAGGWTLEAAEMVVSGENIQSYEVLDLLTSLVDKSLVQATSSTDGATRYRMLETVRQYAHERLLESGGGEAAREHHLDYFLRLSEEMAERVRGLDQLIILDQWETELDNLRLGLEWALSGPVEKGLRLASALMWFWHIHAHKAEGVSWLERLLSVEADLRGSQRLVVGAQSTSTLLTWCRAANADVFLSYFYSGAFSTEQQKAMNTESIALCRAIGEPAAWDLAWGLLSRSNLIFDDQTLDNIREALELCQEKRYRFYEAECLFALSTWALWGGEITTARKYIEPSIAICRVIADPDGIAARVGFMGEIARCMGEYDRAKEFFEEAQDYFRQAGNLQEVYMLSLQILYVRYDTETLKNAENSLARLSDISDGITLARTLLVFIEVEWSQGHFDRSEQFAQKALALIEGYNIEKQLTYWNLHNHIFIMLWLGRLGLTQGHLQQVDPYFRNMVYYTKAYLPTGNLDLISILDGLAVWLTAKGLMGQAVTVFGALDELYQKYAPGFQVRTRQEHDASLAAARAAFGEDDFKRVRKLGQAMTLEQARDFALVEMD